MQANAKFYRLVKGSLLLIAFANKESLKRNVDEGSGQILKASSRKFGTYRICEQRIPPKNIRDVDVGSG